MKNKISLFDTEFAQSNALSHGANTTLRYLTDNRRIVMSDSDISTIYNTRTLATTPASIIVSALLSEGLTSEIVLIDTGESPQGLPELLSISDLTLDMKQVPGATSIMSSLKEYQNKVVINMATYSKRSREGSVRITDLNGFHLAVARAALVSSYQNCSSDTWLNPTLVKFIAQTYASTLVRPIVTHYRLSVPEQLVVTSILAYFVLGRMSDLEDELMMQCDFLGNRVSIKLMIDRFKDIIGTDKKAFTLSRMCDLIVACGPDHMKNFNVDIFKRMVGRVGASFISSNIALEYPPYWVYQLVYTMSDNKTYLNSLLQQTKLLKPTMMFMTNLVSSRQFIPSVRSTVKGTASLDLFSDFDNTENFNMDHADTEDRFGVTYGTEGLGLIIVGLLVAKLATILYKSHKDFKSYTALKEELSSKLSVYAREIELSYNKYLKACKAFETLPDIINKQHSRFKSTYLRRNIVSIEKFTNQIAEQLASVLQYDNKNASERLVVIFEAPVSICVEYMDSASEIENERIYTLLSRTVSNACAAIRVEDTTIEVMEGDDESALIALIHVKTRIVPNTIKKLTTPPDKGIETLNTNMTLKSCDQKIVNSMARLFDEIRHQLSSGYKELNAFVTINSDKTDIIKFADGSSNKCELFMYDFSGSEELTTHEALHKANELMERFVKIVENLIKRNAYIKNFKTDLSQDSDGGFLYIVKEVQASENYDWSAEQNDGLVVGSYFDGYHLESLDNVAIPGFQRKLVYKKINYEFDKDAKEPNLTVNQIQATQRIVNYGGILDTLSLDFDTQQYSLDKVDVYMDGTVFFHVNTDTIKKIAISNCGSMKIDSFIEKVIPYKKNVDTLGNESYRLRLQPASESFVLTGIVIMGIVAFLFQTLFKKKDKMSDEISKKIKEMLKPLAEDIGKAYIDYRNVVLNARKISEELTAAGIEHKKYHLFDMMSLKEFVSYAHYVVGTDNVSRDKVKNGMVLLGHQQRMFQINSRNLKGVDAICKKYSTQLTFLDGEMLNNNVFIVVTPSSGIKEQEPNKILLEINNIKKAHRPADETEEQDNVIGTVTFKKSEWIADTKLRITNPNGTAAACAVTLIDYDKDGITDAHRKTFKFLKSNPNFVKSHFDLHKFELFIQDFDIETPSKTIAAQLEMETVHIYPNGSFFIYTTGPGDIDDLNIVIYSHKDLRSIDFDYGSGGGSFLDIADESLDIRMYEPMDLTLYVGTEGIVDTLNNIWKWIVEGFRKLYAKALAFFKRMKEFFSPTNMEDKFDIIKDMAPNQRAMFDDSLSRHFEGMLDKKVVTISPKMYRWLAKSFLSFYDFAHETLSKDTEGDITYNELVDMWKPNDDFTQDSDDLIGGNIFTGKAIHEFEKERTIRELLKDSNLDESLSYNRISLLYSKYWNALNVVIVDLEKEEREMNSEFNRRLSYNWSSVHQQISNKIQTIGNNLLNSFSKRVSAEITIFKEFFSIVNEEIDKIVRENKPKYNGLNKYFVDAVDKQNIHNIRMILKDSVMENVSFEEVKQMLDAVKHIPEVFEQDNGDTLNRDTNTWDKSTVDEAASALSRNFSHEKLSYFMTVVRHVKGPSKFEKEKSDPVKTITRFFTDAVAENNVLGVRIMIKDSLYVDLSFAEAKEMLRLASGMDGLFDQHDGQELISDKSDWNIDYMNKQMVRIVRNFSHERLEHLMKVIRYLKGTNRHNGAVNNKPAEESLLCMNLFETKITMGNIQLVFNNDNLLEYETPSMEFSIIETAQNVWKWIVDKIMMIYDKICEFLIKVRDFFSPKKLDSEFEELKTLSPDNEEHVKQILDEINTHLNEKKVSVLNPAIFSKLMLSFTKFFELTKSYCSSNYDKLNREAASAASTEITQLWSDNTSSDDDLFLQLVNGKTVKSLEQEVTLSQLIEMTTGTRAQISVDNIYTVYKNLYAQLDSAISTLKREQSSIIDRLGNAVSSPGGGMSIAIKAGIKAVVKLNNISAELLVSAKMRLTREVSLYNDVLKNIVMSLKKIIDVDKQDDIVLTIDEVGELGRELQSLSPFLVLDGYKAYRYSDFYAVIKKHLGSFNELSAICDSQINAFAYQLPGAINNYIIITNAACNAPAWVSSAIIAHEIGHIVKGHNALILEKLATRDPKSKLVRAVMAGMWRSPKAEIEADMYCYEKYGKETTLKVLRYIRPGYGMRLLEKLSLIVARFLKRHGSQTMKESIDAAAPIIPKENDLDTRIRYFENKK